MRVTDTMSTVLAAGDEENNEDNYLIAALSLMAIFICLFVSVILYMRCTRAFFPSCQCCRSSSDVMEMGYLPANITVNPGAVEQGVPDIFIRSSLSERMSMDPFSFQSSRDSASAENSGTWATYLRRATLRLDSVSGNLVSSSPVDSAQVTESTLSEILLTSDSAAWRKDSAECICSDNS